jgi:transposase
VLRDCPAPGSQAQIDYGRLGMWLDPATGRRRTVWAFVMVLPCSRHMFVRPTLLMDQPLPDQLHPDAATHRRIGERFAALPFAPGGAFTAERA